MGASKKINMLEGSLWNKLIVFALPLAFTGMLQQLYNAADVAVLGRFVSDLAVAAVGNNVPVIGLIISFCMGLSLGVNVVVARALGMKNDRKASEAVRTSFLTAIVFGIIALIFGASFFDVFCKITDGWIFGIIFMSAFDLYSKLTKHPEKITPLYIVRLVSALIAVVMFCMAGMVNDIRACYIGLVLAGLFLGIATVSIAIPFAKEKKEEAMELKEFSVEDYEKRWAVLREKMTKLSAEKKEEILEKFLLFKLVEDSIYNNVDFARPLFNLTGEDGSTNYVPVSRAKEFGVSDADIESAREYIKALIG